MTALPTARPVAVKTALVCPCATVTEVGICSTEGLSTASAIWMLVVCAALILTVKLLVAPTFMVKLAGSSAVTATGGATTLTTAEAVVPFKLAVMPAWPSASVPTATGAVVWPASTVTCVEIDTMPVGVAFNGTTVLVLCAAEIVSVSVVLAPRATVDVAGTSDTTVGAAGLTLIWLEADDPFRLAVICAVPGETPVTGMTADTCPASTLTEDATEATFALLLASKTCVFALCAAEMVTVRLPLAPCVTESGLGASEVGLGRFGVANTVTVMTVPALPAT